MVRDFFKGCGRYSKVLFCREKKHNVIVQCLSPNQSNFLAPLRKWMLVRKEQHMLELRKEREKSAAQAAALRSELDSLKELLQAYETSSQRKDEVIGIKVLACHHHHWRRFTDYLRILII